MNLPKDAIDDFKQIFYDEFGEKLSDDEAQERAESFMRLVLIVLRPQPWDDEETRNQDKVDDGSGERSEQNLTHPHGLIC